MGPEENGVSSSAEMMEYGAEIGEQREGEPLEGVVDK